MLANNQGKVNWQYSNVFTHGNIPRSHSKPFLGVSEAWGTWPPVWTSAVLASHVPYELRFWAIKYLSDPIRRFSVSFSTYILLVLADGILDGMIKLLLWHPCPGIVLRKVWERGATFLEGLDLPDPKLVLVRSFLASWMHCLIVKVLGDGSRTRLRIVFKSKQSKRNKEWRKDEGTSCFSVFFIYRRLSTELQPAEWEVNSQSR